MVHRSKIESSPVSAPSAQPQRQRGVTARAVGSFVPRLTQKAMQKYGFSTAALLTDWSTIVGREMAAYTSPLKLVWPRAPEVYGETPAAQSGRPGATLFLKVEAARALDIEYKRAQIVERINGYFGYRAVGDLRIVQAPIAPRDTPRDVLTRKPSTSVQPSPELAAIADEPLKAALARLQANLKR